MSCAGSAAFAVGAAEDLADSVTGEPGGDRDVGDGDAGGERSVDELVAFVAGRGGGLVESGDLDAGEPDGFCELAGAVSHPHYCKRVRISLGWLSRNLQQISGSGPTTWVERCSSGG